MPEILWCLELRLQPLSELLVRQVGKSNVQWFSYPFLPPTTFSGFVASLLAKQGDKAWRKSYIEINDDVIRQVSLFFPGVFSIGAYPEPNIVKRNCHFRQHLGDLYNYEEFAWEGNKKLSIAESFWISELRGFLLAQTEGTLNELLQFSDLRFRVMRVGKKGAVKVSDVIGPFKLSLCLRQDVKPSSVAPLEAIQCFPSSLEIFHVPLSVRQDLENKIVWFTYPCVFVDSISGNVYINEDKNVIIPHKLAELCCPPEQQNQTPDLEQGQ